MRHRYGGKNTVERDEVVDGLDRSDEGGDVGDGVQTANESGDVSDGLERLEDLDGARYLLDGGEDRGNTTDGKDPGGGARDELGDVGDHLGGTLELGDGADATRSSSNKAVKALDVSERVDEASGVVEALDGLHEGIASGMAVTEERIWPASATSCTAVRTCVLLSIERTSPWRTESSLRPSSIEVRALGTSDVLGGDQVGDRVEVHGREQAVAAEDSHLGVGVFSVAPEVRP